MITLVTYPSGWGQPSLSPFCVKAMYLLNKSGLEWEVLETNDPRSFPRGKLPALKVGKQTIGDSDAIRAYIAEHGADMDAHLTPVERADARAYQRMSEEHLYYQIVRDRWANDNVWPEVLRTYFDSIPAFIRGFVTRKLRRNVVQGLNFLGHERSTEQERMMRIEQDLQAILSRLKGQKFLFGDTPCSSDASLGPMLAAAKATPVATTLSKRIETDTAICAYVDRVAAHFSNGANGAVG
ncbi:MAG: glutathione S-transferase family protein [Paracoccaceae bacterium]